MDGKRNLKAQNLDGQLSGFTADKLGRVNLTSSSN
jgi:hypothetical protein